jgi:Domain of unknown function (DUF1835)
MLILRKRRRHFIMEKKVEIEMIHILIGDSPAGCLKVALSEMGIRKKEDVITVSDFLSY